MLELQCSNHQCEKKYIFYCGFPGFLYRKHSLFCNDEGNIVYIYFKFKIKLIFELGYLFSYFNNLNVIT